MGQVRGVRTRNYLAALVVLSSGLACATSPTGRKQLLILPDAQVDELGATAFADLQKQEPVTTNTAYSGYVDCIATAIIAANRDTVKGGWEVKTFESEQVNAFALPGNKVGIYVGMVQFAETPAQLAAVVGHEVGHVLAKHGNERMSTALVGQGGLLAGQTLLSVWEEGGELKEILLGSLALGFDLGVAKPFSRTQETEADNIGLILMAKAGFNPQDAVSLWQKMSTLGNAGPEFLSTHPSPDSRVKDLTELQAKALPHYQRAQAAGRQPNCKRP